MDWYGTASWKNGAAVQSGGYLIGENNSNIRRRRHLGVLYAERADTSSPAFHTMKIFVLKRWMGKKHCCSFAVYFTLIRLP